MKTIADALVPYRAYLADHKTQLKEEISSLEQQSRQDEANLAKIRLNIFEVFETVAQADEKVCTTWDAFCTRYEPRFETLTAPWKKRLEAALRNSDARTCFIEETKLSTADHIHRAFQQTREQNV